MFEHVHIQYICVYIYMCRYIRRYTKIVYIILNRKRQNECELLKLNTMHKDEIFKNQSETFYWKYKKHIIYNTYKHIQIYDGDLIHMIITRKNKTAKNEE